MSQPLDWTIPKEDFFLEMLEVLINSIIYVRNVYPESIFKRQKMYNTTCYICIYPPLREYIQNVLKTAITLKRQDELYKVDLVFEKDETTLEMFSFGFESAPGQKQLFDDDDQYLIEAEVTIRAILLGLDEKCKNLRRLPTSGVNFKILLHTTQVALVKLTCDPKVKEFPWTQGKDIMAESHTILPMAMVSGFQLSAEDFV
ncbi:mitotic spindle assembly checkpoint protein MAD2B [Bradysia coprophila]|uniref:mitotic spindle assembly checkpoint protein MAD2B n=1 Tax=Bradysia coprophila TaxID=38358 RepID=UPI00187D9FDC|nr:mitotic spindle assembly checkpoint protein MAD2B [Bradysia coprophila]